MNPLQVFYTNESEREAVKAYLISYLKQLAGERAVNGESVAGIQEAHETIIKSFDNLADQYGKIEKTIISNTR